jgi:glycerol-3-phosphate acyltransferase PlsX
MATTVAVDAMGGDQAPSVVTEGAAQAVHQAESDVRVVLFGPEDEVHDALRVHADDAAPIAVRHAPEVIGMSEAPAAAVKRKQDSSIHHGLGAVREGQADAFVSAGNTGAVMAAALFVLDRIAGVERPAIVGYCPTIEGRSILVDVGSSVDCRPEQLVQFARMGAIYAHRIKQVDTPSAALLNIGEEPSKGNEQVKAAYELLEDAEGVNFQGNVEGRELLQHAADVIVCDGFVGNILLKFGESVATGLMEMVKREMKAQQLGPQEQQAVKGVMEGVMEPFDYEERGGLPMLGVNGNVIIGHGSSPARAVRHMILEAAEVARQDVARSIAGAFE